jgi:hypothetical protein
MGKWWTWSKVSHTVVTTACPCVPIFPAAAAMPLSVDFVSLLNSFVGYKKVVALHQYREGCR